MMTLSGFDNEGNAFFADLYVGAEEWYSIECGVYLTAENDTLTGVLWDIPAGLTEMDSQIDGTIASVKLAGVVAGVHYIGFTLDSVESLKTQKTKEEIKIEVLEFV